MKTEEEVKTEQEILEEEVKRMFNRAARMGAKISGTLLSMFDQAKQHSKNPDAFPNVIHLENTFVLDTLKDCLDMAIEMESIEKEAVKMSGSLNSRSDEAREVLGTLISSIIKAKHESDMDIKKEEPSIN